MEHGGALPELGLSDTAFESVLEDIARDPGAREARLLRFQNPPCFAVPVRTPEGEWIGLWREVTQDDACAELSQSDVFVLYLGPLPGSGNTT